MNNIKIKSLGPIKDANVTLGDLTLFVGPQASGKSILLQLIKLLVDKKHIAKTFKQYGYIWGDTPTNVLNRYFGEGMAGIWDSSTRIKLDETTFSKDNLVSGTEQGIDVSRETLFYIPAQRVICLQNGWPRFFSEYEDSVPFVLRDFSETLRQLLETVNDSKNDTLSSLGDGLKGPVLNAVNESIFHDGTITLDRSMKKRLKLNIGNSNIPFMAWSAGQKEFMPLLLSFYWLCPPSKTGRRKGINCVIIEEPEMGLHPQAIKSVLLQVIDLMSRGYKVLISTHSPVLLEFAWAFKYIKENKGNFNALLELFDLIDAAEPTKNMFKTVMKKSMNTYYFDRKNDEVKVTDISSLDAGSEDLAVSEWGGLSSFSSKATDIISRLANK